jgi:hypothetical protein
MSSSLLHQRGNFSAIVYITFALLVSSWFFTDLLDLDSASYQILSHGIQSWTMIAETAPDAERSHVDQNFVFFERVSSAVGEGFLHARDPRLLRVSSVFGLFSPRLHGYRVALPRSSPSDL